MQHLEHRVAIEFSVILCEEKNKDTCNLNCPSGAAILIPDFWILHIKASLNVHSFPRCEKNIEITYNYFSKIVNYNPPVNLWTFEVIGG